MIFAIPEVVVRMLSGICVTGGSAVNPFRYLRDFDHVVFDEFHTIDDQAFGLACLFSALAVGERRAKVSLLSATPIDVTGIFERMGVGPDDIESIAEEIVDGHPQVHRPIHGDVTVSLREGSIPESMATESDAIQASIGGKHTAIAIYDSLQRVKQNEPKVRALLHRAGVSREKILAINSIDDSERRPDEPRRGGTHRDPRDYDVLLCTSSVEIGVTFRSNLAFIEPGHGLANFVQRIGRVSRGRDDGQVFVSLPESKRSRSEWTRRIAKFIENSNEISIENFTAEILRDVRRRFEPGSRESGTDPESEVGTIRFFRHVSWRGAFWAALFVIAVCHRKMQVQKGARDRLRTMLSVPAVRFVEAKIREIESVDRVNDYLPRQAQPHKRWVRALLDRALTYQDIGATVEVVDPDGVRHTVSESFLRRTTNIPLVYGEEDGARVIRMPPGRTLDEAIRACSRGSSTPRMTLYVRSRIGYGDFSLSIRERDKESEPLRRHLIEEWESRFCPSAPGRKAYNPQQVKVLDASTALIGRLGWAPLDENFEDSGESALFASAVGEARSPRALLPARRPVSPARVAASHGRDPCRPSREGAEGARSSPNGETARRGTQGARHCAGRHRLRAPGSHRKKGLCGSTECRFPPSAVLRGVHERRHRLVLAGRGTSVRFTQGQAPLRHRRDSRPARSGCAGQRGADEGASSACSPYRPPRRM